MYELTVVRDRLTTHRLSSYLADCGHDLDASIRLYEWNAQASSALFETLGLAEVVLRNALDAALVDWARTRQQSDEWFDCVSLDAKGAKELATARQRATSRGKIPEVHGKVVAELNFGFWVYLMSRRYSTALWFPALAPAFGNYPSDPKRDREVIWQRAEDLKFVRNRVAHHEPVHRRDLETDLARTVEFTEWLCVDSSDWLGTVTRVPDVIASRPAPST